jgi:hypothetical protein
VSDWAVSDWASEVSVSSTEPSADTKTVALQSLDALEVNEDIEDAIVSKNYCIIGTVLVVMIAII